MSGLIIFWNRGPDFFERVSDAFVKNALECGPVESFFFFFRSEKFIGGPPNHTATALRLLRLQVRWRTNYSFTRVVHEPLIADLAGGSRAGAA